MLLELLQEALLTESVSVNQIDDAMDNHKRVLVYYEAGKDDDEDKKIATGARIIEVYAYGLTIAGNPCIRIFQPFGDTASKVPSWKLFRLDRIVFWQDTGQVFSTPASERYSGIGDFNPNGDRSMSVVYKIAKFGDGPETTPTDYTGPKLDKNTPAGRRQADIERFRQQVEHPITLSDIKTQNGNFKQPKSDTGPKLKGPSQRQAPQKQISMDQMRDRLGDTSDRMTVGDLNQRLSSQEPAATQQQTSMQQMRDRLGDTSDRMTMSDLNNRLSGERPQPELYKTDTERGLEKLRQQLANPQKIDLSRIPKR